jgi:glutathione S-transferase
MLTIYHVPGTRSFRPVWLCYELDLPFKIELIDFSPAYRDTPEWRAISPAGKVPAAADDDIVMFESGAIVDYILDRYGNGRLQPAPGTAGVAMYRQWCWFAEATLIRPLGINGLLTRKDEGRETVADEAERKTRDCLSVVNDAVSGSAYLLGSEFSAADIMMGSSLALLARLDLLSPRYPEALSYLERLRRRDAFRRAMNA